MGAETHWRRVRIGELVEVKHGYAFEGQYFSDDPTDDILVTPGNFNIGGGFNVSKQKFYRGPVPSEFVLAPGDVVVTMTDLSKTSDTLGYGAVVPDIPGKRLLHNQRIGRIRFKSNAIDPGFLHYVLRTSSYRNEIVGSASGSTVKHTSPSRIESCAISLPPLSEQRAIAHTLGSLDDKIDLNRRMNETLEAMARALFKSWFVDFDPVRAKREGRQPVGMDAETARLFPSEFEKTEIGEVPSGWRVVRFDELIDFQEGPGILATDFRPSGVPLIRLDGLRADANVLDGCNFLDPEIVSRRWDHFRVQLGDTLLSTSAALGRVAIVDEAAVGAIPYTGIIRMRPAARAIEPRIIRHVLASPMFQRQVEATGAGSVIRHFGPTHLRPMKLIDSDPVIQRVFIDLVRPLEERAAAVRHEARTLASLRDTLLPQLLSGQLRIRDAEHPMATAL